MCNAMSHIIIVKAGISWRVVVISFLHTIALEVETLLT